MSDPKFKVGDEIILLDHPYKNTIGTIINIKKSRYTVEIQATPLLLLWINDHRCFRPSYISINQQKIKDWLNE